MLFKQILKTNENVFALQFNSNFTRKFKQKNFTIMNKIALLYWAPGGNVEKAASEIYDQFDAEQVFMAHLAGFDTQMIDEFDKFIFGCATIGAEVWQDARANNMWNEFFLHSEKTSFAGKQFALFGLGDQVLYPDNFVDSLGFLKKEIEKRGGQLVGQWPTEGYTFIGSEGAAEGKFFGLALDEDQQADMTPGRIAKWVVQVKKEFGI
jgi:flavodoxin I